MRNDVYVGDSQVGIIYWQVFNKSHCLLHRPNLIWPKSIQPPPDSQLALAFYTMSFFLPHPNSLFSAFFFAGQDPLVGEATFGWNSPAVRCQNARLFFRRHFAIFLRLRCRYASLQCNSPNRSFKVSRSNYGLSPVPAWKILIQNKTVRQVLGKLASQSQFRGKLGS